MVAVAVVDVMVVIVATFAVGVATVVVEVVVVALCTAIAEGRVTALHMVHLQPAKPRVIVSIIYTQMLHAE